mgnify:CR=1 FL=1
MKIIGTGSAHPKCAVTNEMLEQFLDTTDEWITERTGIKERCVISSEKLEDLAVIAANKALEDAGLTADEVSALKGKLAISLQEIYDACQTEALLKNHESVYIRNEMDGEFWLETYLTKDYAYDYIPDEEFPYLKFMTDDACYRYDSGKFLLYLFITPDGVGDFASERAEDFASVLLGEDTINETIESVSEKDGCITVKSVLGKDSLVMAEFGVASGKFAYALDAKTREILSIISDYTYDDGLAFRAVTEVTYDAEAPEMIEVFLKYANQTEDLRNVTVVSNPGTEKEVSQNFQIPKGLIVGLTWDDAFENKVELFADAACTESYDPYVNTDSDITICIKWNE